MLPYPLSHSLNGKPLGHGGYYFGKHEAFLLYGHAPGVNTYGTLRESNTGTGYQVPAGKILQIVAVGQHRDFVYGYARNRLAYGDNDVGYNSITEPTNPKYNGNTQLVGSYCHNDGSSRDWGQAILFKVPAGKYPFVKSGKYITGITAFAVLKTA